MVLLHKGIMARVSLPESLNVLRRVTAKRLPRSRSAAKTSGLSSKRDCRRRANSLSKWRPWLTPVVES